MEKDSTHWGDIFRGEAEDAQALSLSSPAWCVFSPQLTPGSIVPYSTSYSLFLVSMKGTTLTSSGGSPKSERDVPL